MKLRNVDTVWYRKVSAPSKSSNKSLGLEDITVYPANAKQQACGIVCNCGLHFTFGHIRVTVARSKKKPDVLYLIVPGQEKLGDTYYQNVKLKPELQAQVLKYVESLME